ncbi:Odorant receptor 49b, partial [Gryllus bimaculatus]
PDIFHINPEPGNYFRNPEIPGQAQRDGYPKWIMSTFNDLATVIRSTSACPLLTSSRISRRATALFASLYRTSTAAILGTSTWSLMTVTKKESDDPVDTKGSSEGNFEPLHCPEMHVNIRLLRTFGLWSLAADTKLWIYRSDLEQLTDNLSVTLAHTANICKIIPLFFMRQLRTLIDPIMFAECLTMSIQLCVLIFQATTSLLVQDAAYESNWYSAYSSGYRKSIVIMMSRAMRESHIKAFSFSTVSLELFTGLLKASYSYYTLLRQVHEEEELMVD